MWLLDTNIISETHKARPHGAVMAWLRTCPEGSLYLSATTLGEIQRGAEMTRANNPHKAEEIESWLRELEGSFSVIPADGPVFRCWAKLMHRKAPDLLIDALIAATAEVHGLTVATRNVRDFEALGVKVINPFEAGRPAT